METILKTNWPKEMDNNRFEQPVQPPVRGTKMTLPDQVTVGEKRGKTPAECLMPLNGVTIDKSWHKVMYSNRNEKPIRTFGTVRTNGGDLRKPLSGLPLPVVNKLAPTDGMGRCTTSGLCGSRLTRRK